jgi:PAS domain S-box-containing protein
MRYLIVMLLLVNHLFSAQNLDKVTLQLHWYHQFQFAGYYMAKEKGFYEEEGIDVEIKEVDLSVDIINSVLQQESLYATGSTSLIADRSNGQKVVLLAAILQASPIVIMTKEHSDIQKIEDFEGKHIDASGAMIDSLSIRALLNERNITLDPPEHIHTSSDIKQILMSDHTDGLLVYNTDDTYQLDKVGVKYKLFHPKDYGLASYSDFLFTSEGEVKIHPHRATAFKKASLKGWEYAFSHIDETVQLILDKYNTQGKTRKALNYEAQALKILAYYKTEKIGHISNNKMQKIYNTYKKIGLIKNDINFENFIFSEDKTFNAIFTKEEIAYLKEKKEITLCGQRQWLPFMDFTNENPQGILVDLAKEYQKIIGIPFRYISTDDWSDCIVQTYQNKIDIALPILTKPNNIPHLIPTKAIAKDYLVLVSKVEKPFISDITKVDKMKVSIHKGRKSHVHYVQSNYPNLELIFVNNIHEGLNYVLEDKVDAYVGTMLPSTFEISQHYAKELKINGRFMDKELTGSIGVHKSDPILLNIFNKAIDTLDPKISREIRNNWISVLEEQNYDYSLIFKIFFGAVLLFLILYFRHKQLKKANYKLQSAYAEINKQQRELKEQKTIYELIFDSVKDGVLMLEDGKFIDCNQAMVEMFKYPAKEDILNLTPSEISPLYQPDGRLSSEKAEEMMDLAFKNGVHSFEWIHTTATGENLWAEITLTLIDIDNKNLLHVVLRDISKRKELEYDNIELKERMELAFRASQDGLWDWDIKNNTYYFSARWKEMLGYRDDELENNLETWQALVHPDDIKEADKELQLNLEGKTDTYEHKHRLLHKDGHWVWIYDRGITQFDHTGNPIRMIGTHTDLTNEMNLSNKLSELNHKLETTIEIAISDLKKSQAQAKLGSWKLDLVHDILTWSDETYNIFELPKTMDLITYKNFINAIHPDDKEKVETAYYNSLKTQEPYEVIHRLLMPDGRIKHVKEHCETTFDTNGEPLISIGTIQDITEEHTSREELREKEEMMLRQSRLAQMGEMLSMIAHQWRQPLNAISLTTSALELKVNDDKYDKIFFTSRLARISDYAQHLSSTIEDFRKFFKPNKSKKQTTLCKITEDALNIMYLELENKGITVQTECNCGTHSFYFSNEILQVVMNLIKNAEDALLENKIINPKINITCYSETDKSVLEVEDNAGGIDVSILDKIFEPYFTTKEEYNGTGLGLYMSKRIIEDHCKGIMSAHNTSEGALFKVELQHDQ